MQKVNVNCYRYNVVVVLLLVTGVGAAAKDKANDPRLKEVDKIFIAGNSRSANDVRKTLSDLHSKTRWKNICISGVANKESSDAVLEIVESVPLGGSGGEVAMRLTQTSATLTLKNGDVVWSNDSQYSSVFILKRLNEAVCRAK